MNKEIELNENYLMLLRVQYVKNVSEGKKSYEISSKIVQKEEYRQDENCIGEIQGEYFTCIPVHISQNKWINNYLKKKVEKKVKQTIQRFYSRSKNLVIEWEQNKEIMKKTEIFIDQIG